MKTIDILSLCLLTILGSPVALAADSPVPAQTPPATRPAAPDINALITQLGAEDFKVREAATDELRKIGRPALPSLNEAAKSFDPEVQARAQALIKDIENAAKPKVAGNDEIDLGRWGNGNANGEVRIMINGRVVDVGNAGNFRMSKTVTVVNNRKTVEVSENQQTVRITEDADGIKMSVTDTVDGKKTTTKYEAKNAAELKEKQPEAYKIYEKNTAEQAGARAHAPRPLRPGVRFAPKPADADDIRIVLPPEVLRELPPDMQWEFGPRDDKAAEPTTRPARSE